MKGLGAAGVLGCQGPECTESLTVNRKESFTAEVGIKKHCSSCLPPGLLPVLSCPDAFNRSSPRPPGLALPYQCPAAFWHLLLSYPVLPIRTTGTSCCLSGPESTANFQSKSKGVLRHSLGGGQAGGPMSKARFFLSQAQAPSIPALCCSWSTTGVSPKH